MARYQSAVHPFIVSEDVQETTFTQTRQQRRMAGGMGHPSFNNHPPYGQIMARPDGPPYNPQMPQQQIMYRPDEAFSNGNMPHHQRMDNQEQNFNQHTPQDQAMDRQEPSPNQCTAGNTPFIHPMQYEYINAPKAQSMYRSPEDKPEPKPLEKIPQPGWIILTRVVSAIFIILDNISDWMNYFEMNNPLDEIDVNSTISFKSEPKLNCTDISDITNKYMYFTIAGSVLSLIQITNISYQIYLEVQQIRGKKPTGENEEDYQTKGALHKARKLLDGRTETFYSTVFIEIPQTLLLLKYQDGCLPGCNVDDFLSDKKKLKKRIMAVVNGFLGLLNNFWRYLTSEKACEESIKDKKDDKCCQNGGCCTGCCRGIFKCCCPCCCCFHRYECSIPCCLWGKTCICDACHFTCDPLPCEFPFGCCTLYYCPLNPKGGQHCIKVERNCCESSDEPLVFHKYLAILGNGIYFLLYAVNVLSMFCLYLDVIVIKQIFSFIMNSVVTIF